MPVTEAVLEPSAGMPGTLVKLKWLTGVRLLMACALLGSAAALDLHERLPFPTPPLYGLLGLTFGLSLAYALALRSQRHLPFQGMMQVALDLVLISLLVHFTGGIDSVLGFMYIFVVFAATSLFEAWGTVCVALLSSTLYGALLAAEWIQLIPPVEFEEGLVHRPVGYVVYQILTHSVAFLAAAILSSHLAQRLRQTGQELERRGVDLRNLRSLHQVIVANISSGLMTLDLAGRVVSFNQAAERITGYAFGELRDRPWKETPFGDCPILDAFFQKPDHSLDTPVAEVEIRRQGGTLIPVGMAGSILRGEMGEPLGLVAIFQDLTERKQVEEQLRRADRLAALGQLAANIAHEIRNPLAAISGSVEILREDLTLPGSHRQLLDIILREAHRLKLITGQFLDFGKPRPLLFRPVALRPLLEETWQLLAKSSECHPETRWALGEVSPGLCVLADADQLRQVIWNLCLNAVQSMPSGGVLTVSVRCGSPPEGSQLGNSSIRQSGGVLETASGTQLPNGPVAQSPALSGGEWVEIAIRDTGRGIPAQELGRIFDPFYTTRSSGTGLGLAIARKILESMDGRVRVESTPGAGTAFRIRLRQAQVPVNDQIPMTNDQPRMDVNDQIPMTNDQPRLGVRP